MSNIFLTVQEKIEPSIVKRVAKELKSLYGSDIFVNGKIATISTVKEPFGTSYIYGFDIDVFLDEDTIENIVSVFNDILTIDFDLEFEYEESEDCIECDSDEVEFETEATLHEQWVGKQLKDGWRYGMVFNESDKTDPKLRPYYQLTDKQKGLE